MPTEKVGVFEIEYDLVTKHDDEDGDYQFGMNFRLSNTRGCPMCQLIFPATSVGSNRAGQWNIDNHKSAGDISSLYYNGSENGVINDTPKELSHFNEGVKRTKFTVYVIDPDKGELYGQGVTFGYWINTSEKEATTTLLEMKKNLITNEEITLIKQACSFISIIK
ncbi:hypothetical protein [Cedecea davisae]|uniref:hypothetical protein n=1 Tax=Cedecea davisae TaxID=158484 RepID=UPI001D0A1CF7|nr:hypothetical protein [Cedecea davisae]